MILLLLACPQPDEGLGECAIQRPDPGVLRVEGDRIVDEHGRATILRGMNTGGRSRFAPYMPFFFSEGGDLDFDGELVAYAQRLDGWGLNVARVPFSWAAFEPEAGVWDEAAMDRYESLLLALHDKGLWTLPVFHHELYSEGLCGTGFPAWTLPGSPTEPRRDCRDWFDRYTDDDIAAAYDAFWADEHGAYTAFQGMWDVVGERFGDVEGVIGFEPLSAPVWGNAVMDDFTEDVLPGLYTDLAAQLAETHPDKLFFFGVTPYDAVSGSTGLQPPEGDNLVFAPHYFDRETLAEEPGDVSSRIDDLEAWAELGDDWGLPVFVGATGASMESAGALDHSHAIYDELDEHGLGGAWFEYATYEELWNGVDLSVIGQGGTERDVLDAIVRPYAAHVAGEVQGSSWNPDTKTWTLTYLADIDGITELVLPDRLFSGSWAVSGEGGCVDERSDKLYVRAKSASVTIEVHN